MLFDVNKKNIGNGYMTVYLSLTMAVLLSLCLTMIEGVRSNAIILESEIACDIALNSLMSEYNRELMKQYNIFAIEDSYGGENASLDNTDAHLASYLNNNFSANHFLGFFLNYRDYLGIEVESASADGVLYLTDNNGEVFVRRAYEAIKDDVGMTLMSEISEWTTSIESSSLEDMDVQENMFLLEEKVENAQLEASEHTDDEPEGEISEETSTSLVVNPAASLMSGLSCGVTNYVVDDLSSISTKITDIDSLVSSRMNSGWINSGNMSLENNNSIDAVVERFVFQEYLFRYMGHYREECEDDELSYQIEYIICGHGSDKDNLDDILSRIFAIRFAAAYIYIQSDEEKKEIAELLATAVSVLTYTEELEDVYRELYLLAWAGTEAVNDLKCLLAGNRIDLYKTSDNWHVNEMLITDDDKYSGDEEGLSYTDYLRVFLTMMSKEKMVARALDMVEADVRNTSGNSRFRIDACIDTIHVSIKVQSTFGYSYSFALKKKYE